MSRSRIDCPACFFLKHLLYINLFDYFVAHVYVFFLVLPWVFLHFIQKLHRVKSGAKKKSTYPIMDKYIFIVLAIGISAITLIMDKYADLFFFLSLSINNLLFLRSRNGPTITRNTQINILFIEQYFFFLFTKLFWWAKTNTKFN